MDSLRDYERHNEQDATKAEDAATPATLVRRR